MSHPEGGAPAPRPEHDLARLEEIAALDLFSEQADAVLQEITAEAAERMGLPVSLVSIVLDEAQYLAAHHGVEGWMAEANGTPVEWSFCANSVRTRLPFVVEDATTHPVVRENPLVRVDGIRCYAGIPLITSRGHVIGNLCVIGHEERSFSEAEMATLRELAARAVRRIEERAGR